MLVLVAHIGRNHITGFLKLINNYVYEAHTLGEVDLHVLRDMPLLYSLKLGG